MPKKIRRRGPSVFHKKQHRTLKAAGWVILAALVISVGFFTAKYMMENFKPPIADNGSTASTGTDASSGDKPGGTATAPSATTARPKAEGVSTDGALRAFVLPVSRLSDTAALEAQLDAAAEAGFNAVLFDLKDENGALHYQSATPLAAEAETIASDALTLEQLKAALGTMKERGFAAIPRLFAFKDPTAPFNLPSAKITLESAPGLTWLDNSKDKGGKPWLNPYAADAHKYMIDLAKELATAGFPAVMLDGVQFPNQTSSAYYGSSELTALSHQAVLQKFIADLTDAVGDGCRVMQTMPGLSAFGEGTEPFGGNPVTFGAATVAPVLMPSTLGNRLSAGETSLSDPASSPYDAVKLAARQVQLRLELMPEAERPAMMPWLQGDGYSTEQVKRQIAAATEILGTDASYILYRADGNYDFAALK